jgi:hypothetical protein
MKTHKINYTHLLITLAVLGAIPFMALIGWGISHIGDPAFWNNSPIPAFWNYFLITLMGAETLMLLAVVIFIIFATCKGIYYLIRWIWEEK